MSRSADGTLLFKRPDGEVIPAAPETIAAHAADLVGSNLALGLDAASNAAESLWDGNAMDYDLTVHALLQDDDLLDYPPKRAPAATKPDS